MSQATTRSQHVHPVAVTETSELFTAGHVTAEKWQPACRCVGARAATSRTCARTEVQGCRNNRPGC